MRKIIIVCIIFFFVSVLAIFIWINRPNKTSVINPLGTKIIEKPLEKYTFVNLRKQKFEPSIIEIKEELKSVSEFRSFLFFYTVDGKKVSGMLNVPVSNGNYPVIVMIRGYVDKAMYTTGEGTRRAAEVFAKNGFITVAPDFLGYGVSDNPSENSIEERFQTYTTSLTLLESLENINDSLLEKDIKVTADIKNVFLWGHSNGGHIALSTLAISRKAYPTVLWNPVSKPFPYSVLYYTDEFEDNGKTLRKVIAEFERDYDIELYSPVNYYKDIQAPIVVHQAQDDEAVPIRWSDQLVENLKNLGRDVAYYTYPLDDHNFSKGSWSTVVQRNMLFYRSYIKN